MGELGSIKTQQMDILSMLNQSIDAYRVPLYQRPFSWFQDNWQELLDDLLQIDEKSYHFLGSLVVVQAGTHVPLRASIFEVVDGQQRLTTLLVLLSVIRDLLEKKGDSGRATSINDYLYSKDNLDKISKLRLGELDNKEFPYMLG